MRKDKLTVTEVKQFNRDQVYKFIYDTKQTFKQQIVDVLGLGLSTVSQNLTALENEGKIQRNGFFESTGGRKANILQIVPTFRVAIGVSLFKKEVQIVAVDLYGQPLQQFCTELSYQDTQEYYQSVCDLILQFITQQNFATEQVLGISIAVQGIVNEQGSEVMYGSILNNTHMQLENFTKFLPFNCRLEHDSKAAARLELWQHPNIKNALVVLLNHNLGGAIIVERKILTGLSMHSGTIEHISIDPQGLACYCGQKGCLEMYCSADTLEEAIDMPLDEYFTALRSNKLDSTQVQIWNDYLNHLGSALRNLNMVIDAPVIFSGYLSSYLNKEDLVAITNKINSTSPFKFSETSLLIGNHGAYSSSIGAALFFIQDFLKKEQTLITTYTMFNNILRVV